MAANINHPGHCSPVPRCDTIAPKAKAPVHKNTFGQAVATPTESGVLSRPDFLGAPVMVRAYGFGHGGGYPQGRPHGLSRVLNRHAHLLRVRTQQVALKSRQGAKPMTTASMASRRAAPVTPSHHTDPVALQFEAHNACSMASYYTLRGNTAGAARKAAQALAALRRLAAFERLVQAGKGGDV